MGKGTVPIGLKLLAAFFAFGTCACLLTVLLLLFPGSAFDPLWRLNPDAHAAFGALGYWAILLMLVAGTACALAALGLARRANWGRRLAIAVLTVNLLGDIANAFVRHDYRALIGLPIAGLMIAYLISARVRNVCAA